LGLTKRLIFCYKNPAAPNNAWLFSGNNTDVKHNALIPGLNQTMKVMMIK